MLLNVLLATFVAGLMIGRTPSYLGKKIRAPQIKLTMVAILVVPAVVLAVAATAVMLPSVRATTSEGGAQGFTEIVYAAASATNGNGSAHGRAQRHRHLVDDEPRPRDARRPLPGARPGDRTRRILRAQRPSSPRAIATVDTTSATFTGLLLAVVLIVGGLTYLPALALTVLRAALGS